MLNRLLTLFKRVKKGSLDFLSKVYLILLHLEIEFFKTFKFLVYSPNAKVISIGNLSLGGTGKTPTIMHLLTDPKRPSKIVLLTRGYKSKWEYSFYIIYGSHPKTLDLTDEILLINQHFPNIPILVGKNRAHSAKMAEILFKPRVILLDDGFQYRRIRHDLDIVLIDTTIDISKLSIIPNGTLREPLSRLADADVILFSRCELSSEIKIKELIQIIKKFIKPTTKIIFIKTIAKSLLDPNGNRVSLSNLPKEAIAFSAIGNNNAFYEQLTRLGVNVIYHQKFRDHYKITYNDLKQLKDKVCKYTCKSNNSIIPMICTTKDRVKLSRETCIRLGIWTLETDLVTNNGSTIYSELEELDINLWE